LRHNGGGRRNLAPTFTLGDKMEEHEESIGEELHKIIQAAINPEAAHRRSSAVRFVREYHKRYGDAVLIDLLVGIDSVDRLASVIVLERSEIDNYLFSKYGIFDEDMFAKIQLTDAWDEFINSLVHLSGFAAVQAVDEVMADEGMAATESLPE